MFKSELTKFTKKIKNQINMEELLPRIISTVVVIFTITNINYELKKSLKNEVDDNQNAYILEETIIEPFNYEEVFRNIPNNVNNDINEKSVNDNEEMPIIESISFSSNLNQEKIQLDKINQVSINEDTNIIYRFKVKRKLPVNDNFKYYKLNQVALEDASIVYKLPENINDLSIKVSLKKSNEEIKDNIDDEDITIKENISFIEEEEIVRYKFSLNDDTEWKTCACILLGESGNVGYEAMYEVTSCVLNRYDSYRWTTKNKTIYELLTAQNQFTAYRGYWYEYFYAMSLDELRSLESYKAIVDCLYSEIPNHNYSQFRDKNSYKGVQLSTGGGKFLDPLDISDYRPLEEREYYYNVVQVLNNKNHPLYGLFMKIPHDDMLSIKYYYENVLIEDKFSNKKPSLNKNINFTSNSEERKKRILVRR